MHFFVKVYMFLLYFVDSIQNMNKCSDEDVYQIKFAINFDVFIFLNFNVLFPEFDVLFS